MTLSAAWQGRGHIRVQYRVGGLPKFLSLRSFRGVSYIGGQGSFRKHYFICSASYSAG